MKVWTGYKTLSDSIKLERNQILAMVPRRIGAVSCSDQIWPCISYQLRRLCQRETGAEYRSHRLSLSARVQGQNCTRRGRTSVCPSGSGPASGPRPTTGAFAGRGTSVATQRTPEEPGLGARPRAMSHLAWIARRPLPLRKSQVRQIHFETRSHGTTAASKIFTELVPAKGH